LAVVVAYGMYKECAKEPLARAAFGIAPRELEPGDVLSFHDFRDKLSAQGLAYSPVNQNYPGDSAMRAVTRLTVAKQKENQRHDEGARRAGRPKKNMPGRATSSKNKNAAADITPEQLKTAKRNTTKSRLCGDLRQIDVHIKGRQSLKHEKMCAFCGEPAYTICPEQPALHFYPAKGPNLDKSCFLDYHNDCCFGLAKRDCTVLLGKRKSEWLSPTDRQKKENARHITSLLAARGSGATKLVV
jgi:hypothetical protein